MFLKMKKKLFLSDYNRFIRNFPSVLWLPHTGPDFRKGLDVVGPAPHFLEGMSFLLFLLMNVCLANIVLCIKNF